MIYYSFQQKYQSSAGPQVLFWQTIVEDKRISAERCAGMMSLGSREGVGSAPCRWGKLKENANEGVLLRLQRNFSRFCKKKKKRKPPTYFLPAYLSPETEKILKVFYFSLVNLN